MSETASILLVVVAVVATVLLLNARRVTTIYPPNVGLLYRDGRFQRELAPGRHELFDLRQRVRIIQVSRAALPVQLGEITVVSRDQFSFRLGLAPIMEVTDARAFAESQPIVAPTALSHWVPEVASHQAMHPLASSAAVEAVAGLGMREIMGEPQMLAQALQQRLADAIPGARIERVLLTSITLPPETRRMFTDVERSKLEAEAGLERARGEQASLRALANAARLIKDNPALANLRFLQTLEQAPGPKTIVLGASAVSQLTGEVPGAA